MYLTYKDKSEFFIVYIREAHPDDGWQMDVNKKDGIVYKQPKTEEGRNKVASDCVKSLKLSIPTLIDNMDDSTEENYAGWPDRIYIIGKDGKVAYKGDKGPRGFRPQDAETVLKKIIGKDEPEQTSQPTDLKDLKLEKDEKNSDGEIAAFRFKYKYSEKDEVKGVLARPSGKGPFPAVIINHGKGGNAEGVSKFLGALLIKQGYSVIACDLTHAEKDGDTKTFAGSKENADRIIMCIKILESLPYIDSKKICMLGISMGAFATVAACTQTDKIKAAAVVSGGIRDKGGLDSEEYIEKITAPVIIIHGGDDKTVKPELAQKLKEALDKHGKTSELKIFDGVGHSVIKDKRDEAMELIFKFFEKHLKGQKKGDRD